MKDMTKTDEKGKEYEYPKIYGIRQSGRNGEFH